MDRRKALVTGASEGIGRSLAKKLASAGYDVTVSARNRRRLEDLVQELGGAPHTFVVSDLSHPEGLRELQKLLREQKFDLLINNAGFGVYGSFRDQDLSRLGEMMRVNGEALFTLSHEFLRTA